MTTTLETAKIPHRLVLVDNGSTDRTGAILNGLASTMPQLRVMHLSPNAGYGGGILTGMRALDTPLVGWCWGDGQIAPEVVVEAYETLLADGLDFVKARRVEREDGTHRRIVSRVYNSLMANAFGVRTSDVNGCPKLFTARAWERLAARSSDWFLDPEVVLKAAELGLSFGEVDATMYPRAEGTSSVSGETVREFLDHLWAWKRGWRPD